MHDNRRLHADVPLCGVPCLTVCPLRHQPAAQRCWMLFGLSSALAPRLGSLVMLAVCRCCCALSLRVACTPMRQMTVNVKQRAKRNIIQQMHTLQLTAIAWCSHTAPSVPLPGLSTYAYWTACVQAKKVFLAHSILRAPGIQPTMSQPHSLHSCQTRWHSQCMPHHGFSV